MVGINAGPGFTALHNVDQFALIGIRPKHRLTFDELLKQAKRVAVLLHSDSRKPPNVTPPFSSAIANDLKGWLQKNSSCNTDKSKAVKTFYANTTGHRGLVWRPYLKDKNGNIVPWTDPAIWRLSDSTPPPLPPKNKKRKSECKKDENHVPDRKRRAYAGKPSSNWRDDCSSSNGPIPERERRTHGTKSSAHKRPSWFQSANNGPIPDRRRSAYAATPMSREQPGPRVRPDTPPSRSSPPPLRAAASEPRGEFEFDKHVSGQFPSHSSRSQCPPDRQNSLGDLIALADMTGDDSHCRIAIASLPDQQECVVIMESHPPSKLRFRVEQFDVLGRPRINDSGRPYWITYHQLISGRHRFLGRFAGATEDNLKHFASRMYFAKAEDSQEYTETLPFAERSPLWNMDG